MTIPITDFTPDPNRFLAIKECTANYDVGSAESNWPNNIISCKTVVYGSGRIAREGDVVNHCVDPSELALCQRLSAEACEIMSGREVGMGSESGDPFRPFFIAANTGENTPNKIDSDLIRNGFGGTLFPPVTITVETLRESGVWWSEVLHDVSDDDMEYQKTYLKPWRKLIAWFDKSIELSDPVFVRIGDREALWDIPVESYPDGTESTGCVLPRLALALSKNGSLIGICGFTVQT